MDPTQLISNFDNLTDARDLYNSNENDILNSFLEKYNKNQTGGANNDDNNEDNYDKKNGGNFSKIKRNEDVTRCRNKRN